MLRISTARTVDLLKQELEIQLEELKQVAFFYAREKIFIRKKCTLILNYMVIEKRCIPICTTDLNLYEIFC
jgi:hypothetical protein